MTRWAISLEPKYKWILKRSISHWIQTARTAGRLLKSFREQKSSPRLLHSRQGLIKQQRKCQWCQNHQQTQQADYCFFSRQQINIYTRLHDLRVTLSKVLLSLLKGLGVLEYIVVTELHEHIGSFPIIVHNCMFWPSFLNPSSSNWDCLINFLCIDEINSVA